MAQSDGNADPLADRSAPLVTRLEVIDEGGRVLTRRPCRIELSYQDDGRTLKVFVSGGRPSYPDRRDSTIAALIVRKVDEWASHVRSCPADDDCPVCAAAMNQVVLAHSVWQASHKPFSLAAARPAPPDPPEGWQPIETAPKDGTEVVLKGDLWSAKGRFDTRFNTWFADVATLKPGPTHWRRLPDPPEANK